MTKSRRLPYQEGDWFAVPLKSGGYAAGLVARASRKGRILLGYFFGPRRQEPPKVEDLLSLTSGDAVLADLFGDLSLIKEEWPVVGPTPGWDHSRWPMPVFGRVEEFGGRAWRVEVPDGDPAAEPKVTPLSPKEARRLPEHHLLGAGAVEEILEDLLS